MAQAQRQDQDKSWEKIISLYNTNTHTINIQTHKRVASNTTLKGSKHALRGYLKLQIKLKIFFSSHIYIVNVRGVLYNTNYMLMSWGVWN